MARAWSLRCSRNFRSHQAGNLELQTRFRTILDRCVPYLISYPANWPALELSPYGLEIAESHRFTATELRSRDVVDGLHRLDNATFFSQDMGMARWVLFDCGEFPGIVFGFGCKAGDLPEYVQDYYNVIGREDTFVPLSMWVAIRCAEADAWFGHNLSSANLIFRSEDSLPGLAVLTKCLGALVARARTLYGATQWDSSSIGIHQKIGDLEVLCAYTPAHTHPQTFAYRTQVDPVRLQTELANGFVPRELETHRSIIADDVEDLLSLQRDLESGNRYLIAGVDKDNAKQRRIRLKQL